MPLSSTHTPESLKSALTICYLRDRVYLSFSTVSGVCQVAFNPTSWRIYIHSHMSWSSPQAVCRRARSSVWRASWVQSSVCRAWEEAAAPASDPSGGTGSGEAGCTALDTPHGGAAGGGRRETGVNSRWVKQSFEKLLATPCCGRSLSFIEDTAGMTEGGFKLKCVADAARETVQSHDLCCHLICGYLLIATVSVLEMELKACITSGERWWTSCYLTVQPNHQFAVPVAL